MDQPLRKVIDLRAYAADARPTRDWLNGRSAPAFADASTSVVAFAPAGEGRVSDLRANEYLLLISGQLRLKTARGAKTLTATNSAVLPAGLSFEWQAAPGTVLIIVAHPDRLGSSEDVVSIDESAPLTASNPPLAELLVGPTPSCRNFTDYKSTDGTFMCGTWDSTPYHRRAMPYKHIELMYLLDGSVTLEEPAGSATFNKGDVCLVTRGAICAWISHVHVEKVYAIHRPA
jgi:uncharacterized cupin superfamily protein